jgi:hypothetical protein
MIKLNNKNITYVALADSNNSTIGVKEIWYADTNNSVKLVYRRKDALIEGEDYEKFHWLCGRNGAYIDTDYIPLHSDSISCHYRYDGVTKNPDDEEQEIFGLYEKVSDDTIYRCRAYINSFNRLAVQFCLITDGFYETGEHITDADITDLHIEGENFYFRVNGVQFSYPTNLDGTTMVFSKSLWIFSYNVNKKRYFHGDIAYFRITDSTFNVDKVNMIPCQLLKPVPKWLDANGIRRQVGECGMIDLISGKFYGNVNSVGTFTVENYYERKEWLHFDSNGSANAEFISLPINSSVFNFTRKFIKYDNNSYLWTGSAAFSYSCNYNIINIYDFENNTVIYKSNSSLASVNGIVAINSSASSLTFNEEQVQQYDFPIGSIKWKVVSISDGAIFDTSSITVDGIERYIPCTLTMDLPASMDANNIARTKGTSGMWDLVSDKFYGNVASSGTFKAVNLAEGVDYEVHDKLIVEDGKCILPLNSEVFECTIENLSNNNNVVILQASSRYTYHYKSNEDNTSSALTCWDLTRNTDVVGKYHLDNPSTFISDGTTFKCNGSNVTKYGFPPNSIDIHSSNSFKISISAITVDGVERYIPVKLLRSIPSKYDANGIARQAGECGMYDTVNDVFYGNVASSGSFTVSDDN